jgi:hypothetical protein
MPPKQQQQSKSAPAPPEPEKVENDPAVIAAREAAERHFAEERKLLERDELLARRRTESMEVVGWKCVLMEKERRFDPELWNEKMKLRGPPQVFVKTLTGNRGIPQVNLRIPFDDDCSLDHLKDLIQKEYAHGTPYTSTVQWFAPPRQKLFYLGKEVVSEPLSPNSASNTIAIQQVPCGATLHLTLHFPAPYTECVPSMI